jgi:hypothetical protein
MIPRDRALDSMWFALFLVFWFGFVFVARACMYPNTLGEAVYPHSQNRSIDRGLVRPAKLRARCGPAYTAHPRMR